MYYVAVTPREQAEAYLHRLYAILDYVMRTSPKARVFEKHGVVVFKYTGIGSRYTHHIYVEFKPMPKEKCAVIRVLPAYPMYLFAVMSPLATISCPAVVIRAGEEARALLVEDKDTCLELLSTGLSKYKLIEPGDLNPDEVGFEGLLYSTPAGYIAFSKEREFELIDTVEGHVEDDDPDAITPAEYFTKRFGYLWITS